MRLSSPACMIACCASLGFAQTVVAPESNGPLVGVPAMFSASSDTKGLTSADAQAEGWFKRVGFASLAPVPLGPAVSVTTPDFSAKALFRDPCLVPPFVKLPEVDAMSLGLDWLTVEAKGLVRVPAGHWSGLVFSVRRGTKGKHGQLAGERTRTDTYAGSGADVFSFIFKGSILPPELVNVTQRSNDASEVRLPKDAEIDAVDVYAALYRLGIAAALRLPKKPSFYFSVSSATLGSVPASWWGSLPKSGATIFESAWDGTKWSCPRARFAPADLGLKASEDVDAFAYDKLRSKVVLSTRTKTRNPILYVDLKTDAAVAVPVVYDSGGKQPISDPVGLDLRVFDDVDAICGIDPGPTLGVRLGLVLGQPLPLNIPPTLGRLRIQAHRDIAGGNPQNAVERLLVAGGQPGGLGVVYLSPPGGRFWFNPFAPVPVPRNSPFHGHPFGLGLLLPPRLPPLAFDVIWVGLPATGLMPLDVSLPLGIQL